MAPPRLQRARLAPQVPLCRLAAPSSTQCPAHLQPHAPIATGSHHIVPSARRVPFIAIFAKPAPTSQCRHALATLVAPQSPLTHALATLVAPQSPLTHHTDMQAVFTAADAQAWPQQMGCSTSAAHRAMTRLRSSVSVHLEGTGLFMASRHIDLTDADDDVFNWRAWMAARQASRWNYVHPSIFGEGIARVFLMAFNEFDPNLRMCRMDIVLELVDTTWVRLHPDHKKEAKPLVFRPTDEEWLILESLEPAAPVHKRITMGRAAERFGIYLWEPPVIVRGALDLPFYYAADILPPQDVGGVAPAHAATAPWPPHLPKAQGLCLFHQRGPSTETWLLPN